MGRKRKKSIAPSSSPKKKKIDALVESKKNINLRVDDETKTEKSKKEKDAKIAITKTNDESTNKNDNDETIRNKNDANTIMAVEEKENKKDVILQHAVTFLECTATNPSSSSNNKPMALLPFHTNDSHHEHHLKKTPKEQFIKRCTTSSMIDSTTHLSLYLAKKEEKEESLLQRQDVASIILPWSIAYLLRSTEKKEDEMISLAWEVLNNSLVVLSSYSSAERLATLLSQSVCNKLVLLALSSIADEKKNEEEDVMVECFTKLCHASINRPRLDDFLVDQIFPLLNSCLLSSSFSTSSKEEEGNNAAKKLIVPTLHLLAKVAGINIQGGATVMSGMTNPKRVYTLLSSPATLATLARFFTISSLSKKGDDNEEGNNEEDNEKKEKIGNEQLCKNVLWLTFFDPIHHLDGFKFMNMSVPTVNLELAVEEEEEEIEHEEKTKMHDDKEETKEKKEEPDLSKMSKRQRKRYRKQKMLEEEEEQRLKKKKREEEVLLMQQQKQQQEEEEEKKKKVIQVEEMKYPLLCWGKRQNYQQNLFTSIYTLLLNNGDNKDEATTTTTTTPNDDKDTESKLQNAIVTAQIIPILIEGFIHQTMEQHHNEKHDKGPTRKVASDMIHLTFCFWCNLVQPLLIRLRQNEPKKEESELQHYIVQSIQKSLFLLIKYDIYSPNNDDDDNSNYNFLSWTMETMLNYILSRSLEEEKTKVEVLKVFQYLLECNHHLIHDDLSTVLLFASSCLSAPPALSLKQGTETNIDTLSGAASALVSMVITTYSKLRQIGHLISCVLDILPSAPKKEVRISRIKMKNHADIMAGLREQTQQHGKTSDLLSKMLQDSSIIQVLSSSIRNCPPGQTKSIWNIYTDSIQEKIKQPTTPAKNEKEEQNIEFIIELFILFLRSVKVDRYSAHEIMSMCDSTMKTLVSSFMANGADRNDKKDGDDGQGGFIKYGLYLCSWLVDLHTRCCFWLNRSHTEASKSFLLGSGGDNDGEEKNVLSFLVGVAKYVVSEGKTNADKLMYQGFDLSGDVLKALQHLACHRIQQLHSIIYQMEQLDDDDSGGSDKESSSSEDSKSKSAAYFKKQAESLVDFCVYAASASSKLRYNDDNSGLEKEEEHDNDSKSKKVKKKITHASNNKKTLLSGGKSSWTILSQSIATWTTYSKTFHIRSFLYWMYSVASAVSTVNNEDTSHMLGISTTDDEVNDDNDAGGKYPPFSSSSIEDQSVALSLVRDATFYEIPQVAEEALSVGLSLVIRLLQHGINNDELFTTFIEPIHPKASSLHDWICNERWKTFGRDGWINVLDPIKRLERASASKIKTLYGTASFPLLKRASNLIKVLNGMPEDFLMGGSSKKKPHHLDKLLRIEKLTRFFIVGEFLSSNAQILQVAKIGCACREAIARLMIHSTNDIKESPILEPAVLKMFLNDIYQSSVEMMKEKCSAVELDREYTLTSMNGVVGALLHACIEKFEVDSDPMLSFMEVLDDITSYTRQTTDDMVELVNMSFMRSVIQRFNILTTKDRNSLNRWNEQSKLKLRELCSQTIKYFRSNMLDPIVKDIAIAEEQSKPDEKAKQILLSEMILLLSDVLRFWSFQDGHDSQKSGMASDPVASKNVSNAFKAIINILLKKKDHFLHTAALQSSASYFLCAMSVIATDFCRCVTSESALIHILNVMRQRFIFDNLKDPVIDSSFCGILQLAGGRDIQMIHSFLLDNLNGKEKASERYREFCFVVHCFQLLLLAAKGQEQRNELSNISKKMLLLSLELLAPKYDSKRGIDIGEWLQLLNIGKQCLLHLIRMNDVLRLNSRDISVILCQVNALLPLCPQQESDAKGDMTADAQTFSCCCTILSSLLKHHPKQLYGCAPSLFCALGTLWTHAIYGRLHHQTSHSASQQMYELTRVFEALALHKQIFKKHVVGLLLIFVDALEKGMSPSIKQILMPSAFCLLDMCSKFELRQLNMLMNKVSRPLFSVVYENYQKLQYKGQF